MTTICFGKHIIWADLVYMIWADLLTSPDSPHQNANLATLHLTMLMLSPFLNSSNVFHFLTVTFCNLHHSLSSHHGRAQQWLNGKSWSWEGGFLCQPGNSVVHNVVVDTFPQLSKCVSLLHSHVLQNQLAQSWFAYINLNCCTTISTKDANLATLQFTMLLLSPFLNSSNVFHFLNVTFCNLSLLTIAELNNDWMGNREAGKGDSCAAHVVLYGREEDERAENQLKVSRVKGGWAKKGESVTIT